MNWGLEWPGAQVIPFVIYFLVEELDSHNWDSGGVGIPFGSPFRIKGKTKIFEKTFALVY
jgi:hypothetical protein